MEDKNINVENAIVDIQKENVNLVQSFDDLITQIIQIRKEKNLSQKQASRNSGVAQSTISRLESGQLDPGLKLIIKYLNSLNKAIKIVDI